jgi:hypothetical protein
MCFAPIYFIIAPKTPPSPQMKALQLMPSLALAPLILSGASCFSAGAPGSALTAARGSCFSAARPGCAPPRGLRRAHVCARRALRNGGYGTKEYWDDMYRGEGDVRKPSRRALLASRRLLVRLLCASMPSFIKL